MNLNDLNSAASVPLGSIILWVVALAAVIFGVIYWSRRKGEDSGAIIMGVLVGAILGCVGLILVTDAHAYAKSASFQRELKAKYGLQTSSSLDDFRTAAKGAKPISVVKGEQLIDVRPQISAEIITFYRASDGKVIDPS